MEGTVKQSAAAVDDVRRRLELLEGKFASASFTASSTRTTDVGTGEGGQRPALVAGGWDADQDAETTLKLVKEHIERLQVDLDLQEAFVPGLRRGFAIIPINPRDGETQDSFRNRIRSALRQIREARIVAGDRPEGGTRYFWAEAGVGWINLPALARQLGTSLHELTDRWEELRKPLQ